MGGILLLDLAYAAGVALSPTPIIIVILILFGSGGKRNALAFLIGWIIGLALLAVVLMAFDIAERFLSPDDLIARPGIQVLLGLGIVWLAYRQWKKPPPVSAQAASPKWIKSLDTALTQSSEKFTPMRALGLGVVMSALSAKNIALMLAIILAISQFDSGFRDSVILLTVFVLVGSLTIGMPVVYAWFQGDNAQSALTEWKDRIVLNRSRAMALVLAVLGGVAAFNGIVELVGRIPRA